MPTYSELMAEIVMLWDEICRLRKENERLRAESCGWISAQDTASYRNMLLCSGVKETNDVLKMRSASKSKHVSTVNNAVHNRRAMCVTTRATRL